MLVAAAGVLMNGVIALLLWKVSHDVNMRSVFVHMLGDALGSVTAITIKNDAIDAKDENHFSPLITQ